MGCCLGWTTKTETEKKQDIKKKFYKYYQKRKSLPFYRGQLLEILWIFTSLLSEIHEPYQIEVESSDLLDFFSIFFLESDRCLTVARLVKSNLYLAIRRWKAREEFRVIQPDELNSVFLFSLGTFYEF